MFVLSVGWLVGMYANQGRTNASTVIAGNINLRYPGDTILGVEECVKKC